MSGFRRRKIRGFLMLAVAAFSTSESQALMRAVDDGCGLRPALSRTEGFTRLAPLPYCDGGAGGGSAPALTATRDSRCQSHDLCVFAKMPLYYQQDPALEALIRQRLGVYDGGLCVPTSTSMVLAGVLSEADPASTRDGWLSAFENSWDMKERIYQAGLRERTDFEDGGTFSSKAKKLIKSVRENSRAIHKNKFIEDGIGEFDHTKPTTADLIGKIRSEKYAIIVGMDRMRRNKNFWGTSWKRESGHALAINGFDRDALKIYDPWAEIYYVRLRHEHLKLNGIGFGKDRSVVDIAGGFSNDWGFVANSQSGGFKVILKSYVGWSFH